MKCITRFDFARIFFMFIFIVCVRVLLFVYMSVYCLSAEGAKKVFWPRLSLL